MNYRDFIRSNGPLPARRGAPEQLTQRRRVTETVPLSSKAPKARKRVTEAAEPANGRSAAEYIRSGDGGGSSTSWPIPRFAAAAATFAAQVLGIAPKAPPPPPIPSHLVALDDVEQFIARESERLGCVWRPTLNTIVDWHRAMSPFHRAAMGKVTLWDRDPPVVCLDKAGLLDLVRFKAAQLLAQPQPEAPAANPPLLPSQQEHDAIMAADARARTTPGQIIAEQNAAWRRQQQQAEALAEPAKT